jgi:signal transduction histidine kinase
VGADEDLVAQALGPLLDNAVRHAHRAVTVATSQERTDVVFSVQDDGEGIGVSAVANGDGGRFLLRLPGLA